MDTNSSTSNALVKVYREIILDLPDRPPEAPFLYECFNHPLAPSCAERVFFFFIDTTYLALRQMYLYEKAQTIPYEKASKLKDQGFVQMNDREYLFAACTRLNDDRRRPEYDVIKMWATTRDSISKDAESQLDIAAVNAQGPVSDRDTGHSFKNESGRYAGATAIQRSCRMEAKKMAYTLGPSMERWTAIVAPPQSGKLRHVDAVPDQHLVLRKDLITAGARVAMENLKLGPQSTVEDFKILSDFVNAFRLGDFDTFGFTTAQLNVSDVQSANACPMFDLGNVGSNHADKEDHARFMTDTTSCGDFSVDTDPGAMVIVAPRVYVRMDYLTSVCFSGRHYHGAVPASTLEDDIIGLDKRMLLVFYPQRRALDVECRYPIFMMPDNCGPFFTTSETRFPEKYMDRIGTGTRSTFARDGKTLSDRKAHVAFIVRELYTVFNYGLLQMPAEYQVQVDADQIMSAVSYVNEKGVRVHPPVWANAPGSRRAGASRLEEYEDVEADELVSQSELRIRLHEEITQRSSLLEKTLPHVVGRDQNKELKKPEIEQLIKDHVPTVGLSGDFNSLSYSHRKILNETNVDEVRKAHDQYYPEPVKRTDETSNPECAPQKRSAKDSKKGVVCVEDGDSEEETGDDDDFLTTEAYLKLVDKEGNERFEKKKREAKEKKEKAAAAKKAKKQAKAEAKVATQASNTSTFSSNTIQRPDDGLLNSLIVDGPYLDSRSITRSRTLTKGKELVESETRSFSLLSDVDEPMPLWSDKDAPSGSCLGEDNDSGSSIVSYGPTDDMEVDSPKQHVSASTVSKGGKASKRRKTAVASSSRPVVGVNEDSQMQNKGVRLIASPHSLADSYPFLNAFNCESLVRELRLVEHEVTLSSQKERVALLPSLEELREAGTILEERYVSSSNYLDGVTSLNAAVKKVTSIMSVDRIAIRMAQQQVLQSLVNFAYWLYVAIPNRCEGLLETGVVVHEEEEWLHKLLVRTMDFSQTRLIERSFVTHDYGVLLQLPPRTVCLRSGSSFVTLETDIRSIALKTTQEVITAWSGGPEMKEHWRLFMLLGLERYFPRGIGLLSSTWRLFNTISKTALLKSAARRVSVSLTDIEPFFTALASHPLTNIESLDAKAVLQIRVLCHNTFKGAPVSTFSIPFQLSYSFDVDLGIPFDLYDGPSRLKHYLLECLTLFADQVPSANLSPLQAYVKEDINRRLPFRECLPIRLRMQQPDGPYHGSTIASRKGLFSAIIWRAITIHSEFALAGQMVFNDLDEWQEAVSRAPSREYVCSLIARRVPNPKRTPELAETYWENVNGVDWEEYILHGAPSFWKTFSMLYAISRERQPYPYLGPLGALEVAADIAYSGYYDLATTNDIAKCMAYNNSGSTRGLYLFLGLNHKSDVGLSVDETRTGLDKVIDSVKSYTTEDHRKRMVFDPIMVEHLLCKFHGAVKSGLA